MAGDCLDGAARVGVNRVQRMAAGHEQAVVFGATKTQVGTTLGQMDVANRGAIRCKHAYTIELFRLGIDRTIATPAAPNVAFYVDGNSV